MKIPNLASLYQSGTWYCDSEFQSGRNGPWLAPRSTSARIALRGASYFALAFCQTSARDSGLFAAVGVVDDCAIAGNALLPRPASKARNLRTLWKRIWFTIVHKFASDPMSHGLVGQGRRWDQLLTYLLNQ